MHAASAAQFTRMSPDRDRAVWALAQVAAQLRRIGGVELADDAAVEARWGADLFHPWDGDGAEPVQRLCARLDIMTRRLERADASEIA